MCYNELRILIKIERLLFMIKFQLTPQDYLEFNLRSDAVRKLRIKWGIILSLIALVASYTAGVYLFKQSKIFWAVFSVGVSIFAFFYWKKVFRQQLEKQVDRAYQGQYLEEKTLTIEDGVWTFAGKEKTKTLNEEDIVNVEISDTLIALYIKENSAHLIPRSNLSEAEDKFILDAIENRKKAS